MCCCPRPEACRSITGITTAGASARIFVSAKPEKSSAWPARRPNHTARISRRHRERGTKARQRQTCSHAHLPEVSQTWACSHCDPSSGITFGGMTGATDGFGGRHTVGGQIFGWLMPPSHSDCIRPSTHWQVQAALAALPPINKSVSAKRTERMRTPKFHPDASRHFSFSVQYVTQEPATRSRFFVLNHATTGTFHFTLCFP